MNKRYIPRESYLKNIIPYVNKDIVKIIVGQRRVGKSYMLFQIIDYVKSIGADSSNIIYINKELHEFNSINSQDTLLEYIKSKKINKKKRAYVFIDEIQEISQYEKAVTSLQSEGGYDIYCTGSNANMVSGELATYLSGRYIEIKIFGLSYNEFLLFHNLKKGTESFLKYVKYGGLPYLINLRLEDSVIYDYLRNIYNAILYKDVVARHNLRNINFLERLVEYLSDNTGNIVSAKKISDFLKSQKTDISPNIVLNYLSFLSSAFFIFKVKRTDIIGKKIFEIGEKYYFEDLGLRHSIIGYRHTDIGKILENIVFLHLKSLGYEISVGTRSGREVDFVCEKEGERLYIQVTYIITDQKARDREFGNLLEIKDNFPKMVLSMDETAGGKFKGIAHCNIIEFLVNFKGKK